MKSHTFPLVYHFLISVDNGGFIHEKVYSNSTGRCDGDSGHFCLPEGKFQFKKQKFRKILILKL